MAQMLENLMASLQGIEPYTPLSEEEIRRQAQRRYQSVYDQKRLSAQQTYEMDDAALARELAGLQKSYDAQRASAAVQTRNNYSQADRHALSRGMQRSSYNESTLAQIDLAGAETQRGIDQAQGAHEAEIGEKRTLLNNQLSQTLQQLETDRLNDELAYADELTAREYDRVSASRKTADQLALQLYEYQHQLEQEAAEQARWQAEFDAKYGSASYGSAGRSTTQKKTSASQKTTSKVSGVRNTQKEMMQ